MTLHIGDDNIVDIRKGDTKIAKVYHGSDLVWGYIPGQVLFESSTPGTYQLYVKCRCKLDIKIVGAGGGATSWGAYYSNGYTWNASGGGGSGAYIHGTKEVFAGTYTIVVGKGGNGYDRRGLISGWNYAEDGTDSSAFGQVAGGGKGGSALNGGFGGDGGVASTTLTGVNGEKGGNMGYVVGANAYPIQNINGGASKYGGYGAGGYIANQSLDNYDGKNGYVRIVAIPDTLVTPRAGVVLFESSVPGTYNLSVATPLTVHIDIVGGGGGGYGHIDKQYHATDTYYACGGGSGSYITGTLNINAGNHTIVVGGGGINASANEIGGSGGSGGKSSCFGQIANGGDGADIYSGGSGGDYYVDANTLTGQNGNSGGYIKRKTNDGSSVSVTGGSSLFPPSGAGGNSAGGYGYAGVSGYVRIVIV